MKAHNIHIVFLLFIGILFTNNTCKAQYVLNGSFEDNSLPWYSMPTPFGPHQFFKNVESRLSDTIPNISPTNRYLKDTSPVGWFDSPVINSNGYIIRPAPHGKTYMIIHPRSFWKQYAQVIFTLSDTLKRGKRYNISFFSSIDRDIFSNQIAYNDIPIIVGFGKTTLKEETRKDSIYIVWDTTHVINNYRRYVMSIVAEDNYKYLYLYMGECFGVTSLKNYMVDDLRLDTCANMLPVKYKSCATFPDTLKPSTIGKKYYWNTGDTTETIVITKTGNYRAYVYDTLGCCTIDSFVVTDYALNGMVIPIQLCSGGSQLITAKAAVGTISYKWNNGDTTQTITINKGGTYWVIRNVNLCSITDTFIVIEYPLPVIKSLHDTIVCFDQVAKILLDAGQFKSYLWKPTNETSQIIYANRPLQYLLQVTDSNNCVMNKQITVAENCEEHVYIPNAFSPNGDGINDVFNIVTTGVESFEMTIFNRWGEQVFNSQNYLQGWDGKNVPNEVYVVQVTYKLKGKPTETVIQNVTLLR